MAVFGVAEVGRERPPSRRSPAPGRPATPQGGQVVDRDGEESHATEPRQNTAIVIAASWSRTVREILNGSDRATNTASGRFLEARYDILAMYGRPESS